MSEDNSGSRSRAPTHSSERIFVLNPDCSLSHLFGPLDSFWGAMIEGDAIQSRGVSPSSSRGDPSLPSSTPSSSSPPPIWAVQVALQAILVSIQQLSESNTKWAAFTSNTAPGIPSFGIDQQTGSAIQPTIAQIGAHDLPIGAEAWDEYKATILKNAEAVKGLRSFKTAVARETEHLEKLVASSSQSNLQPCPSSSNAPFLCLFWQQVLQTSLTRGPLVEMNASFPIPAEGSLPTAFEDKSKWSRRVKRRHQNASNSSSRNAKIDIVGQAGKRWVRILTIKRSSLLAEFREAESYLAEDFSDSDDGDQDEDNGLSSSGNISSARATRLGDDASLFAQLDQVTANCSIIRTIEELLACRAATAQSEDLVIELNFTRIRLYPAQEGTDAQLGPSLDYMRSVSEQDRYEKRLQCISNLIHRLPNVVIGSNGQGVGLPCPPGKMLPSSLASGHIVDPLPKSPEQFDPSVIMLPAVPGPADGNSIALPSTRDLNLDVSALVALASDISHMQLPTGDKRELSELESLFRVGGLKTQDLPSNDDDKGSESGEPNSGKAKDAKAKYLHGRALALQLALEAEGKSFLGYLSEASRAHHGGQPIRLHTTLEAADKFREIMRLVAGPREQIRGRAMFTESKEDQKRYWTDSRYAQEEMVKNSFTLPIQVHDYRHDQTSSSEPDTHGSSPRDAFGPLMKRILQTASNPEASSELASNPRQTTHTINTLLMGLDLGMTTLTTNMLSIRWLVREIGRKLDYTEMGSNEAIGQHHSLIMVTNPRSLAERMRVKPDSPNASASSSSSIVSSFQHAHNSQSQSNTESNYLSSEAGYNGRGLSSTGKQVQEMTPPLARGDTQGGSSVKYPPTPAGLERQGSSSKAPIGNGYTGSDPGIQRLVPALSRGYTENSSILKEPQTPISPEETRGPSRDTAGMSTMNYHDGHSQGSYSSDAPFHHNSVSVSRFQRTLRWIAGPRPPAELTIRHYKWWPFATLERNWLRWTDLVAWRDPAAVESTVSTRRRRPAWLKRGLSQQVYDLEDMTVDSGLRTATSQSPDRDDVPSTSHARDPVDSWRQWFVSEWRVNRIHWLLLFITYLGWLLGFSFVVKHIWNNASVTDLSSGNSTEPSFFGCTTSFWAQNERCGDNGQDCSPFSSNTSLAFRCPSGCSSTKLGAARAVGTELPNFIPLVVGDGIYRGDSWICPAAVHAGIIDESKGGCGTLWQIGAYSNYTSSNKNGINSVAFDSSFPSSYLFDRNVESHQCSDERTQVYILDVILSAFTGFVLQPKMIVWYYTLICLGFWHINYASEPRDYPPTPGEPMGDFLPTLFIGYALWRLTFRFILPRFSKMPIERTIWTLGAFWIGVLLNVVFANVPLQRLVANDLQKQPGALTALIIIIVVVIVIAINQIRVIRKTGYLPKYLTLTILGGIIIGLLTAIPETGLRLHHYIIALVLLPFTAFPTRLSLIYAMFLLGMFLNGVGRWGYDGIIQDEAVIRGDDIIGSKLPLFITNGNWTGVDKNTNTGYIYWEDLPSDLSYDGFDLMVDDVLRLSSTSSTRYNLASLLDYYQLSGDSSNLTYYPNSGAGQQSINDTIANQPHYIRLAYTKEGTAGDFTSAAVAYWNGTWIDDDPDVAT
ncbi:unnamed protein product [Sympodiomycopsis kandeliae]